MANETIVVADDTDVTRDFICKGLREAGYNVIPAKTLDELETIRRSMPDLIIMDALRDETNAVKFAIETADKIPIIWTSASVETPLGSEENYLPKPMSLVQLRYKVRSILDARKR